MTPPPVYIQGVCIEYSLISNEGARAAMQRAGTPGAERNRGGLQRDGTSGAERVGGGLNTRKIACCFQIRNGAAYLKRNVVAVEAALVGAVTEMRFFYVENDSSDATRTILDSLAAERPGRFEGVQLDISKASSVGLCRGAGEINCGARRSFLATLRQRVMQRALGWAECTLVLMLDLDVIRFESAGPLRLLQLVKRDGTDGAFGMSVVDGCDGPACFYDVGALVADEKNKWLITNGRVATVRSAFSGFGMYSAAAIRHSGARYNNDTSIPGIAHESFNLMVGRLLVDGSFRPVYEGKAGHQLQGRFATGFIPRRRARPRAIDGPAPGGGAALGDGAVPAGRKAMPRHRP